ncbi:MAG: triose-phosphate isomerase [Actinomycetaceae bacterium]|nr:triose-phosphate isomerase [Actinomycetaceae bacterium]MDY5855135.1 triose-phosphate isomerase family protein [Arcanobacterium sp.]
MRTPVVAVSLKMYFNRQRAVSYIRQLRELTAAYAEAPVQMAVFPDHLVMAEAAQLVAGSPLILGAQDLAPTDRGAWTGEVSGADLADLGVKAAEIGHYERRTIFAETPQMIAQKLAAAVRQGMIPLLCVGEERKSDPGEAADQCLRQIDAACGTQEIPQLWIGYEPYWAIGAAEPASAEYVSAVARSIRAGIAERTGLAGQSDVRLLYGGSAGPGLLSRLDTAVDGLFLGRFAHDPAAFVNVVDEALARGSATGDSHLDMS